MYSKNEEEIFKILNSNIDGLDSKETEKRLKNYGQNIILNKKKKVWILRFLKQFNDTMIIILLVVALFLFSWVYWYYCHTFCSFYKCYCWIYTRRKSCFSIKRFKKIWNQHL